MDNEIVIHKFYATANAIYSHVKFASEVTVLFLIETFYLPFLSYASEALNYSKQQLTHLNVHWNRAYRKAFSMNEWMSVKELQALCGRLDFVHICDECKLVFWSRISNMKSIAMQTCYGILGRVSSTC